MRATPTGLELNQQMAAPSVAITWSEPAVAPRNFQFRARIVGDISRSGEIHGKLNFGRVLGHRVRASAARPMAFRKVTQAILTLFSAAIRSASREKVSFRARDIDLGPRSTSKIPALAH